MPFRSWEQEKAMFANAPEVAKRWVQKYGHAPDMPKKRGRVKKTLAKARKRRNVR